MSTRLVEELTQLPPAKLRQLFREGLDIDTGGLAPDFVQASVTIVPADSADDFRAYCTRNPIACPLIEELAAGAFRPRAAPGADIRTDLPAYHVVEDGRVSRRTSLLGVWRDDLVAFLLGCGYTQIGPLLQAGVRLRHLEEGFQQPVYVSSLQTEPAGPFHGPIAVSMMPLRGGEVVTATLVSARYAFAHGAPVWVGDPVRLGIADLGQPSSGKPPSLDESEVPVFWACSQTPLLAALSAGLPFFAQHAPARMLITDLRSDDLADRAATGEPLLPSTAAPS